MAAPEGYTKVGVVGYSDKGTYSPYTVYNKYNTVTYDNSTWVCKLDGTQGITPAELSNNWQLMAKGYRIDFDDVPTAGSDNAVKSGGIFNSFADMNARKQDVFINASILGQVTGIDTTPTLDSDHLVTSGGVKEAIDNIPGGTVGSLVKVTTTETTLFGQEVRLTQGSNFYSTTFSDEGTAEFTGVTMTGEVTITSTDGTDTAQKILTIPYFGNYTERIAFWQATINVTTTRAQFDGLTVYAKKNGAVMGSAVFSNGSASITVPESGTYTVEVTYSWKTYASDNIAVTEETTYTTALNGFIATISLSTITEEFYGKAINVTVNGSVILSTAFDNTGHASYEALQAGTYVFRLTYAGEPYTATVIVSAETTYSAEISMWTANIRITTSSSELYGKAVTIKKAGTTVGSATFSSSGVATYTTHEAGTYTVEIIDSGWTYSKEVAVSAETTYTVVIDTFNAVLNISTSSSDLYSQTITIKKGSTVIGTTAFSAQGSASYTVHETGTYTCECEGYSGSATVSAETTYNVTINAGLDLSAWITAGSTTDYPLNPSSYADFSALEADEAAVRQLMLVHDAVDYLATASAGDSLMQSVINSDVCAKWINLSDYALDTLSANSDIADEMATADKYGYGEWGIVDSTTTPPTWGALGNVPIMTANNAPYGEASGDGSNHYLAFDGNYNTNWECNYGSLTQQRLTYKFNNPVMVNGFKYLANANSAKTLKVQASNDGSNWTDLTESITYEVSDNTNYPTVDKGILNTTKNQGYYLYYSILITSSYSNSQVRASILQFYGRELSPLVPTMTGNTSPRGTAFANTNNSNAYKAFDGNGESSPWNSTPISSAAGTDFVGYTFPEPVSVKEIVYQQVAGAVVSRLINATCKLEYSTDGTSYQSAGTFSLSASVNTGQESFDASIKATHWRVYYNSPNYKYTASEYYFYMGELQFYSMDYSEKEFAAGSTRKTIYDHGVELVTIDTFTSGSSVAEKQPSQLYGGNTSSGTYYTFCTDNPVNFANESYTTLNMIIGNILYQSGSVAGSGYVAVIRNKRQAQSGDIIGENTLPIPASSLIVTLNVSAYTESGYPAFYDSAGSLARKATIKEMWLE